MSSLPSMPDSTGFLPTTGARRSRLKRETAFLCPIEFKNDAPDVPVEWKIYSEPANNSSFTQYLHVPIGEEVHGNSAISSDLGLVLDPVHLENFRFQNSDFSSLLDDGDLLEDPERVILNASTMLHSTKGSVKNRRPDLSKALWLMNTQYISSMKLPEHLGRSETEWAKRKFVPNDVASSSCTEQQEIQMRYIESSFSAALHALPRYLEKNVFHVGTLPVFPDFNRWPNSYVNFVFDEEPEITKVSSSRIEDVMTRLSVLEHSVAKPYASSTAALHSGSEKFVAMMLPTKTCSVHDRLQTDSLTDFSWSREYQYRLSRERTQRTQCFGSLCMFFDHANNNVKYVDLNTKLALSKRTKHAKSSADGCISRPAKVTVKRIAIDTADNNLLKKRRTFFSV